VGRFSSRSLFRLLGMGAPASDVGGMHPADSEAPMSARIDRSLDGIYRRHGPVQIDVAGKIAEAVLEGLTYLYDVHRIIHRGGWEGAAVTAFATTRVSLTVLHLLAPLFFCLRSLCRSLRRFSLSLPPMPHHAILCS
jgi:hypothetical protein